MKEQNVTISNVEEQVLQTIDVDLTINSKEEEVTLNKEELNSRERQDGEESLKLQVIEAVQKVGLASAAKTFSIPLSKVWQWKDEARRARQVEERKLGVQQRKEEKYSEELKAEALRQCSTTWSTAV